MTASSPARTITVTLSQIAKLIDHSLLHPTLTDAAIAEGLETARDLGVAAACIKPYSIAQARAALAGSDVRVCAVVGFPAGGSTTAIKVTEAAEAVLAGAHEVDVVVNVGKVLGGDWAYVADEVAAVHGAVTSTRVGAGCAGGGGGDVSGDAAGTGAETGLLKVIFENDYLEDAHIVRLCEICTEVGVAFVKTSTGYGFVKQPSGMYSYRGATVPHLRLMNEHCGNEVQIKAAGGLRTLDDFLYVMSLGITRVGASATAAIMEEAKERGITNEPTEVTLKDHDGTSGGAY